MGDGLTAAANSGTTIVEQVAASSNWWCSSGRNTQANNATIVQAIVTYNAAAATNANGLGDPRTELMLTNCHQLSNTCGVAAITALAAVGTGTST